jgi:hypothetical protein
MISAAQFSAAAVLYNYRQPLLGADMRKPIVSMAIAALLLTLPVLGSAKGCLKGAAVGGVVGHVAGRHAVVGAAAGCVIEHHREKVKEKEAIKNEKKEAGRSV